MNVTLIEMPYNLDQVDIGMGKAPRALLDAGIVGRLADHGAIVTTTEIRQPFADDMSREQRIAILQTRLRDAVVDARRAGTFPLVLGGDCMNALGVLAGLGAADQTGIVWCDAHGDFNTPATTTSGYLGGMPLACAVGRGLDDLRTQIGLDPINERCVALLGVRDLDPAEEQALQASNVMLVHAEQLQHDSAALDQISDTVEACKQVYLHLDIDALDPSDAPGVDYPAPGGLSLAQLQAALTQIGTLPNLAAMSLTAINPDKDNGHTVGAALTLIETVLTARREREQQP